MDNLDPDDKPAAAAELPSAETRPVPLKSLGTPAGAYAPLAGFISTIFLAIVGAGWASLVAAVAGIILGHIAFAQNRDNKQGDGLTIFGLVLSYILLFILTIIFLVLNSLQNEYKP